MANRIQIFSLVGFSSNGVSRQAWLQNCFAEALFSQRAAAGGDQCCKMALCTA